MGKSAMAPLLLVLVGAVGCGASTQSSARPGTATPASNGSAFTPGGQNHVHTILIEPNNPNALYLGSHYRLYKSLDGGRHWQALFSQMMYSMVQDPAHPSDMFGITLQTGLMKSTDAGARWRPATKGVAKGQVVSVLYDPHTGALLAFGAGIYRSTNRGSSWKRVLSGTDFSTDALGEKGTMFAGSLNGLYVSRDGGAHWSEASALKGQPVIQVASAGSTVYAATPLSLFRSTDNGVKWQSVANAPQPIEFLGVGPSLPAELIAEVAGKGFEVSDNCGKSWSSANRGISGNFASSTVRIAPSNPRIAYTGSWGLTFFRSTDGGHSWSKVATLKH